MRSRVRIHSRPHSGGGPFGSRTLTVSNLRDYLPPDTTEIVSGGAKGIDACARDYTLSHGLKLTEFLPDYPAYGRAAPLKRNLQIIAYSDLVLAFWDGKKSRHPLCHPALPNIRNPSADFAAERCFSIRIQRVKKAALHAGGLFSHGSCIVICPIVTGPPAPPLAVPPASSPGPGPSSARHSSRWPGAEPVPAPPEGE